MFLLRGSTDLVPVVKHVPVVKQMLTGVSVGEQRNEVREPRLLQQRAGHLGHLVLDRFQFDGGGAMSINRYAKPSPLTSSA